MQNFQIESKFSSEKFYEPGLYQLQYYIDGNWNIIKNKEGSKNIEYLAEYPISEFELKEIFNSLYDKANNVGWFDLKIIRIPYEFKTTSETSSQESA